MDRLSRAERSELMSRIRSSRTRPEMALHSVLRSLGIRHKMWPGGAGNPDVLIYPDTVVFMHGCFWHACPRHYKPPKTNKKFWAAKVAANKRRHSQATRILRDAGFKVRVVWEHDLGRPKA